MRTLFLLDLDCFFASVEMARRPELRGVPLCVGGLRGERGIVACPNYEARRYGVKTAMPIRTAERLLPSDAVFLRGNHRLYGEYADRVMSILHDFTPDVEQVSVDEAYMDVTGCLHLWRHDPLCMAAAMKERIRRECGLTVSIGIASRRVCAKIAAGLRKPDGLVRVPDGGEEAFLFPLPVEMLPGVGPKTLPKMLTRGVVTIGDLMAEARAGRSRLGQHLLDVLSGTEGETIRGDRVEHSISRDTTFGHDTMDPVLITATMYYLLERCCKTLRSRNQMAATVTSKVRFADFTTVQRQVTLASPTANEEVLFPVVRRLTGMLLQHNRSIRLVGVKVSHLCAGEEAVRQIDLGLTRSAALGLLHRHLDTLQEKHGYHAIQWGITCVLRGKFDGDEEGYRLHSPVYGMRV